MLNDSLHLLCFLSDVLNWVMRKCSLMDFLAIYGKSSFWKLRREPYWVLLMYSFSLALILSMEEFFR